jgi:hypothetical protein
MNNSWFKPILEATMPGPLSLLDESMLPWIGAGSVGLLLLMYVHQRASRTTKSGKPTLSSMGLGYKNQRMKKTFLPTATAIVQEPTMSWLDSSGGSIAKESATLPTTDAPFLPINMPDTAPDTLNIEPWVEVSEKNEKPISFSNAIVTIVEEPFVIDTTIGNIGFSNPLEPLVIEPSKERGGDTTYNILVEEPFEIVLPELVVIEPRVSEVVVIVPVVPEPIVLLAQEEEPLEITLNTTHFAEKSEASMFDGASAHIVVNDTPLPEVVAPFKLPMLGEPEIHKNKTKVMSTLYPLAKGLSLGLQESLLLSPKKWYRVEYLGQYNVLCERDVYIEYLVQGYNNQAWYQVRDRLLSFSGLIGAQHIYHAINLNDYQLEFAASKPYVFDGVVHSPERNYVVENIPRLHLPWTKKNPLQSRNWAGIDNATWQSFATVLLNTFDSLPDLRDSGLDDHLSSVLYSLVDSSENRNIAFDFNTLPSKEHYWYSLHSLLCSDISLASTLVVTLNDIAQLLEDRREKKQVLFSSILEPLWMVEQRYADIWGSEALLRLKTFN